MLKRIFSVILALALVISLTACDFIINIADDENNRTQGHIIESDNTTTSTSETSSTPQDNNPVNRPSVKPNTNTTQGIVSEKPTQIPNIETPEISSPSIEIPEEPKTSHTALSRDSYYQYSNLNKTEKEIYNKIYDSISKTENVIDLEKYDLSFEKISEIYQKVLADNPQFFWVSKFWSYSISSQGNKKWLTTIYLYYTDGSNTDNIEDGEFTTMADREKINMQIDSFNTKAESFLKTVSPTASVIEKERLIHDFVLKNITYDYASVGKKPTLVNHLRVWDSYGALVNGKAVCEGYARLFQYLCYQVGINATYVHGTSQGVGHAWNVVKLGNMWYHIDTTWDDGSTDGMPLYTWFNLTQKEIEADHEISSNELFLPEANGVEYSLANTFALTIESLTAAPANYKKAIDYMVKFGDSHLTVITNGIAVSNTYFNKHLLGGNSTIGKYIKEKGYSLEFAYTYSISSDGKYLYLHKK